MPARPLDLEVLRKGRPAEAPFQSVGDPEDISWLQKRLRGYLEAKGWDKSRWNEFEIIARDAGKAKQLAKVPAL